MAQWFAQGRLNSLWEFRALGPRADGAPCRGAKVIQGRVPVSCRLWGLVERRKLPLRGPRQSPGQKRFCYFVVWIWKNTYTAWQQQIVGSKPMGSQLIMYLYTTEYTGIEKGTGTLTFMASTWVRACYGGQSRGCAPSGVQGQSPWWEVKGRSHSPTEAESILKCTCMGG